MQKICKRPQSLLSAGKYTVKSIPGRPHFWAPNNHSFSCTTKQKMTLKEYGPNNTILEENVVKVYMYMSDAQIQAFDLPANGKFSEGIVSIEIQLVTTVSIE